MTSSTYNKLKWVALIALPALTALWLTIGTTWSLPYTTEIGGTMAAVDTFLGALLGISSKMYTPPTDGTLHVTSDGDAYASFNQAPQEMAGGTATLDVRSV